MDKLEIQDSMKTAKNKKEYTTRALAAFFGFALLFAAIPQQASAWNLQGSCAGIPSTVFVGEPIAWSATQTSTMKPSEGHYEWSWSGTDGLSGSTQSVSKSYSAAGTKNATVVIKLVLNGGGTEKITRSCSVVVKTPPGECKMEITKAVDKTTASIGDTLTYTINFKNIGTADCTGGGVKLKDIVDQQLQFLSETHSANVDGGYGANPVYQSSSRTLWWNAHELTPGETGFVTWKGKVTAPVSCGSFTVENKASITSFEYNNFSTWMDSNKVVTAVSNDCPSPATLKVIKQVVNDNGGTKTSGDFSIFVKQGTAHVTGSPAAGSAAGVTFTLSAGTYAVGENDPSSLGYTMEGISGDCSSSGTIALAAGENKICTITNNDIPVPPELNASCTGSPSSPDINQQVTWAAQATGGTGSYAYSWTGTDGLSGSVQTILKSYATAGTKIGQVTVTSGTDSKTAECSVQVKTPPSSVPLSTVCSVNPSTIRIGESVDWSVTASGGTGSYAYSWTGTDGLSDTTQTANKSYASAGTKNGIVEVTSGSEIVSATCSINVLPPPGCTSNCGGGGGFNPPKVVLLKSPPEGRVLSAVYLSQIPYTGIGDWYKIPLFILILALWSASVVYFIRSKAMGRSASTLFSGGGSLASDIIEVRGEDDSLSEPWIPDTITTHAHKHNPTTMQTNYTSAKPVSAPVQQGQQVNHALSAGVVDVIAAEAQRGRTVISEEGMYFIAEKSGYDAARAVSITESVILRADGRYSREEGWLLLNKEKVISVLSEQNQTPIRTQAKASPEPTFVAPQRNPAHGAVPERAPLNGQSFSDSATFVSWLASGDKTQVVRYLNALREKQGGAEAFLKKIVLDLDAVYRSRFEEIHEPFDERLAHAVSGLSNTGLEELISALISTVDQNYRSTSLGVKLALMRASEIGKNK